MKIKQIKTFILAITLVFSALVGAVSISNNTSALTCPSGQELHTSDNLCWTKETVAKNTRGGCPAGSDTVGNTCVKYTRSTSQPKNDDGSTPNFSCASGQEYHSSDNKCWTKETVAKNTRGGCPAGSDTVGNTCVKYTESSTNPTVIAPATDAQKKAARDDIFNQCKTSGKSDDECNKLADQAATDCAKDANYTDCMSKKSSEGVVTGTCTDNSTPDASTGKCADGSDPVVPNDPGGTGTKCGEAETVLISCKGEGVQALGDVLRIGISVLTLLIGIAALGGLGWASVIYAKAADNASEVSEARGLIRNIVIGLFLYGFMVAIINFLIPGGVFG